MLNFLKFLFESFVDDAPNVPILKQIFIICKIATFITIVLGVALGLLYGLVWIVHAMWLSMS